MKKIKYIKYQCGLFKNELFKINNSDYNKYSQLRIK